MFGNSQRKRRLDVHVVAVGVLLAAAFLVMASGAAADRLDERRDRPDRSDRTRWRKGATGAQRAAGATGLVPSASHRSTNLKG
jgi:hypothetical protein